MMKENTKINLLLISCFAGGILLILYFKWQIFGGGVCGSVTTLLTMNYFGQRQLEKATARLDKIMKDRLLAADTDNDNLSDDE